MIFEQKTFTDASGIPIPVTVPTASQNFGAGSCEGSAVAAVCLSQPTTTAWACVKNFTQCRTWPDHGPAGTRFFTLGLEATCGSSAASFIDKHYLNPIQYRYASNWVNVTTPLPFKGITVDTAAGPITHGGTSDFDLRMCLATSGNKVIGWLHDNQTNPSCN